MIFTDFTLPSLQNSVDICTLSDGNLWTVQGLVTQTASSYSTAGIHLNSYTIGTAPFVACCAGPDGNMWAITSTGTNGVCWRITTGGSSAGVGLGSTSHASNICSDGTYLWVCGYFGNIYEVSTGLVVLNSYAISGTPDFYSICFGPDGNLWCGDVLGNVLKINTSGTVLATYSTGSGHAVNSISSDGTYLWATVGNTGYIYRVTTSGTITGYLLSAGVVPNDSVKGPDGNIYVAVQGGTSQYMVTPGGTVTALATGQPAGCSMTGVCVGSDGNIWWVDYSTQNQLIRGAFPSPMQIVMNL